MKLRISKRTLQGAPQVAELQHRNFEPIPWRVELFSRTQGGQQNKEDEIFYDVFDHINRFWEQLPEAAQDKIYDVYVRCHIALETAVDSASLTLKLIALAEELYAHHDFSEIHHWVRLRSDIILPKDVQMFDVWEEVVASQNRYQRERTYTKEDYWQLVSLSVALRPMIPIWGEFCSTTKETQSNQLKEFFAYKLLGRASINRTEAMARLARFVELSIPPDQNTIAATIKGVSTQDFPVYILGLVLVRKLCMVDIRGVVSDLSIVRVIHRYIQQRLSSQEKSFVGIIKPKKVDTGNPDTENNLSRIELTKTKQEHPIGDDAANEVFVDLFGKEIVLRACPDIDLQLYYQAQESVEALVGYMVKDPQISLLRAALYPAGVAPQALDILNRLLLLKAMACGLAIFWHKGYYELAALMTATSVEPQEAQELIGTDTRSRMKADPREELDKLFPYVRKAVGKNKQLKRKNPAMESIEKIAEELSQYAWRLTLPQEWLPKVIGNRISKRYPVPADIRIRLATLATEIAQGKF